MKERDVGVPGALKEALARLVGQTSPELLDRVWIFPPIRRGRTESGLLAAGCFASEGRRLLVTLAYRAEETGRGVSFEPLFQEEGEAPEDRLPRVMEGVVQRSEAGTGEPRSVTLGGDPGALEELLEELGSPPGEPLHGEGTRTFGSAEEAST